MKAGLFREDLYYRLNVFPVHIPPLRERREDIPELARHFAARFAAEEGKTFIRGVDTAAMNLLSRYNWPGNVRQLENAVFRAVVLADGPILSVEEFPQIAAQINAAPAAGTDPPSAAKPGDTAGKALAFDGDGDIRSLADVEAEMIRLAVARYQGHMTIVARKLGIGRSTLYRKLKDLGISDTVAGIAAE